jgi:hypothetical protein
MKLARLVTLAMGLAFASSGSAAAATWCVPDASPGGCDFTRTTISATVFSPGINNGDTVKIAPGSYPGSGDTAVFKRLNFVGAGAGTATSFDPATQTRIQGGTDKAALTLAAGGTLRSLQVQGGGSMGAPGPESLVFDGKDGDVLSFELSGVVVRTGSSIGSGGVTLKIGTGTTTPSITVNVTGSAFVMGYSGVTGIEASASADVDLQISGSSFIALLGAPSGTAIGLDGDAATITDSKVDAGANGIVANRSALTLRRSVVSGANQGIAFEHDSATPLPFEIVDSLIHTTAASIDPYAAIRVAVTGSGQANLVAQGSTIVARGSSAQAAVLVTKHFNGTGAVTADLRNTLARVESSSDPGAAELLADRGTIMADFSAFSSSLTSNGGSAPTPGSASNVTGDPGMVNTVAGDFSLLPSSPLVDRGDASVVAAGQLVLPGAPRSLDGNEDCQPRPDIGAFELTGHAAACPETPGDPPIPVPETLNGAPIVSELSMTRRVFAPLAATAARAKRGTRFLYRLSEAATVAIGIERARSGRRVGGKCRKTTRKNRRRPRCTRYTRAGTLRATQVAGKQSTAFSGRFRRKALAAGRYRARVTATDALGARSAERRVRFRVVKPSR